MAESSTLCISSFSSYVPFCSEPMSLTFSFHSTSLPLRRFPFQIHRHQSSPRRFVARAAGSGYFSEDDDSFGLYPWQNSDTADSTIQWIPEERVTLFTADGLIQIGGKLVPRRVSSSDKKQGKAKLSQRYQRFQESNYMDPNQSLCLGALFDIAATNGLDVGRRLCIIGFCRSIEMLCDVVEDTVLEHGGEVLVLCFDSYLQISDGIYHLYNISSPINVDEIDVSLRHLVPLFFPPGCFNSLGYKSCVCVYESNISLANPIIL